MCRRERAIRSRQSFGHQPERRDVTYIYKSPSFPPLFYITNRLCLSIFAAFCTEKFFFFFFSKRNQIIISISFLFSPSIFPSFVFHHSSDRFTIDGAGIIDIAGSNMIPEGGLFNDAIAARLVTQTQGQKRNDEGEESRDQSPDGQLIIDT